jgi:hypothetical protein
MAGPAALDDEGVFGHGGEDGGERGGVQAGGGVRGFYLNLLLNLHLNLWKSAPNCAEGFKFKLKCKFKDTLAREFRIHPP